MRTPFHTSRSLFLLFAFLGLGLIALVPTPAQAERPEPAEIDDVLPDFTAKDRAGQSFQLSKLDVSKADIEKAVRKVAATYGAAADAKLDTEIDKLSGLQDDGDLDIAKKREMLAKIGGPFGRVTTEESVAPIKTLGDAVKWVEKLNGTPVIFICWGPRCPTSSKLNDAIHETLAATDARAIALACNYNDTDKHMDDFIENMEFWLRIVPDHKQEITAILGGRNTPQFMIVDKDRKLRYRGGLDNDPFGMKEPDEKQAWVADAVKAIAAGKEIEETETRGPG